MTGLPDRIVVVGMSGAGKSTLARAIAQCTSATCIEVDALFWGPGWEPRMEFRADITAAVAQERWVLDGNYSSVRSIVWPRAQMIVWLNLSFPLVLWRTLLRTVSRIRRRTVLWQGNRESLARTLFTRESILWWVIANFRRRRADVAAARASGEYPHLHWVELRSAREVDDFIVAHGLRPTVRRSSERY